MAKTPGPSGAQEWGHGRLSGRSGRWALAGWGWRGRDSWVPGLRAGQTAGSLLPGEPSDLLSPPSTSGLLGRGTGRPLSPPSFQPPVSRHKSQCPAQSRRGGWRPPAISSRGGTEALGPQVHPERESLRAPSSGSWGEEPWTLLSCRGIGTRLLNFGNEGLASPGRRRGWGLLEAIRETEERAGGRVQG